MAVHKSHIAPLIVSRMRAAPIWIIRRHASCARIVPGGIVENPTPGFFRTFHGHTFIGIRRIHGPGASIGQMRRRGWPQNFRIANGRPLGLGPYTRPVTATQPEVGAVIRDGFVSGLAWIKSNQFLKFFRLARAKQQVGCLLIGLQEIEPRFSKHIRPSHLERITKAAGLIVGVEFGREGHLPKIVKTTRRFGFFLGAGQRWQQKARENANNGNNHQKFDQSEGAFPG